MSLYASHSIELLIAQFPGGAAGLAVATLLGLLVYATMLAAVAKMSRGVAGRYARALLGPATLLVLIVPIVNIAVISLFAYTVFAFALELAGVEL